MKLTTILSSASAAALAAITLAQPAQSATKIYPHPAQARLQANAMSYMKMPAPSKLSLRDSNPAPQPAPIQPVEQRKIKIQISKLTFGKIYDNYAWSSAIVCSKEVPYNVYDMRNQSDPWPYNPADFSILSCDSDFSGQPVKLNVGGAGVWHTGTIFGDEPNADVFSGYIFFSPDASKPTPKNFPALSASISSRDLHPQSAIISAYPLDAYITCSSQTPSEPQPSTLRSNDPTNTTPDDCTTNYPEFFYVTAEIRD